MLHLILSDEKVAIYRLITAETARFPELGRAFYDNGPAALLRTLGAWLAEQGDAGRLAMADPIMAAEQLVGMLRTSLFLRASVGLTAPSDAEIDATVEAAVTTFVKAYAAP